ncbi:lantibiotic dehydratase [Chitinophaga sp.]|uniref:lantibiotic dehydratase n=1 Tax=Chitinophaga sp. TaxID=1869181 RepID=UPI002F952E75
MLATCGFYLLRMPLLSCEELLLLHCRSNNKSASFIAAIREMYARPLLQEAVFLASPALYAEMMKWLAQPDSQLKLPLALYRYLLRMGARCTPYGLFAGCATGRIGTHPSAFSAPAANSRHKVARLDMEYLSELMNELVQLPELRQQLRFYPNNSRYQNGHSFRYFEYQLRDKKRYYFLSAFTQNEYINTVLTAAAAGARIEQLLAELVKLDVALEEAHTFIESLITHQILVAGLTPAITGEDGLSALMAGLRACEQPPAVLTALQRIQHLLHQPSEGVKPYLEIKTLLTENFPAITAKDPVQVDLFFPTVTADLSSEVTDRLLQRLEKLAVLGTRGIPTDLQTFKQQFLQQYDQREIPLMMALDSESGIGYGIVSGDDSSYTPLIDDLVMPAGKNKDMLHWNAQTKFVWQQFLLAQQQQATVIHITDADLDELTAAVDAPVLPPFLSVLGSLLAPDAAALDRGDFQLLLKSCNGPNALALLGRFAAGDPALQARLKTFAQMEQALEKDRILAEVVHLPEGRTGNVLLRPQLYDYEIPFLGKGGVADDFLLPVSDLYVAVRDNSVVLRSARLNREVLPRLTSAHNFSRGLSAYKFLCDLQQQQSLSIHWNWGHLTEQSFLPRVVYREIILERARWYIPHHTFAALLRDHSPEAALQLLKTQYRLPDLVLLSEGDNDLLIDLNNVFAGMLLINKLKKGNVVLYEQLFNKDTRLLANESGFFCNEVIIPICNTGYKRAERMFSRDAELAGGAQGLPGTPGAGEVPASSGRPVKSGLPASPPIKRSFPPGSEWLYVKIYCGPKWMDKLLLTELLPLINQLQEAGLTDHWFFIRFQDPDHHLRVRFHLPHYRDSSGEVMQRLQEVLSAYLESDIVQKIQFDTYIRELERYGPAMMSLSEQFFFHDSVAVVRLLSGIAASESRERWLLALKGADELLRDFGCTPLMKLQLLGELQQQFFAEHHGDAALLLQLNNKYRQHTRLIASVLDDNGNDYTLPVSSSEILHARGAAMRALAGKITAVHASAAMELLPHYLHMFLNRMFSANARLQELVVYHYLMKYYTSKVVRG